MGIERDDLAVADDVWLTGPRNGGATVALLGLGVFVLIAHLTQR